LREAREELIKEHGERFKDFGKAVLGDDLKEAPPSPEVNAAAGIAWQSFEELAPLRSVGFGGGDRLSLTEINEYAKVFLGLTGQEDLIAFARMIFILDDAVISRQREKSAAATVKPPPKKPTRPPRGARRAGARKR
jgi:hypothetical protein